MSGISRQQFRRRLLKAAGYGPRKFLLNLRMEKAAHELEDPEKRVAWVAHLCGFRSRTSFIKTFTRHFGLTPSQYREGVSSKQPYFAY
jgi:AraC-like DNA-binding protein